MIKDLIVVSMEWVTFREGLINQKVIIVWLSSLEGFLSDHLHCFHFLNEFISDTMHKLFDIIFKDCEQQIWVNFQIPFFKLS